MLGVLLNVVTIVIGSIVGLIAKKFISDKMSHAVMVGMGLVSVFIGIKGALSGKETIVVLISVVLGTVIGTALDLEGKVAFCGDFLKKKMLQNSSESNEKFIDAFITGSVLMGIGAMAIVGSIEAGLLHKYDVLILKSIMDGITSIMLSASMGIGILFSSITIFVLQGAMTLFSGSLKFLAENKAILNEINCTGSILIVGIGFNVMGITKLKIVDMAPAIIITPIIYFFAQLIGLI